MATFKATIHGLRILVVDHPSLSLATNPIMVSYPIHLVLDDDIVSEISLMAVDFS